MEGFCEQVVKKKVGFKQRLVSVLLIGTFVLLELIFILLYFAAPSPFWIMMNFMVGFAAVFIITAAIPRIYKTEFDYSVVGNTLYVDKVIASKKRKSFNSVEIATITDLALIEKDNVPNVKYAKTYDCSEGGYEGNYYCIYHQAGKGKCLMIFSPSEKILQGMRPFMTREVQMKLFIKK